VNIVEILKLPGVAERRRAAVRAAMLGRSKSEEQKRKTAEALRGRRLPHSPEHEAKRLAALRAAIAGKPRPREVVERIAAAQRGRPRPGAAKNLHGMTIRDLTPEQNARRLAAVSRSCMGHTGHGRCARGRPDHARANWFMIRFCPTGEIHQFSNLAEWARQHQGMFHDDAPNSRMPFAIRIAQGISKLAATRKPQASSRGWELIAWRDLRNGRREPTAAPSCH
jgi:hypothetical protein